MQYRGIIFIDILFDRSFSLVACMRGMHTYFMARGISRGIIETEGAALTRTLTTG